MVKKVKVDDKELDDLLYKRDLLKTLKKNKDKKERLKSEIFSLENPAKKPNKFYSFLVENAPKTPKLKKARKMTLNQRVDNLVNLNRAVESAMFRA